MSDLGYYVHVLDAVAWLRRAQSSVLSKNKVRKELWQELMDVIHWDPLSAESRHQYLRIPRSSFVAMQTFCLVDGKGGDSLSSDQMLNFTTTLDDLRSRLPASEITWYSEHSRRKESTPPLSSVPLRSLIREYEVAHHMQFEEEKDSDSVVSSPKKGTIAVPPAPGPPKS